MIKPDRNKTSQGNILIVDDTPANLRLLASILGEHGYHVRPVPSGPLALAAIQALPPDLILLDIRMPDMNGYEVSERLKADNRTRDIPIIFISALDAVQDKVKAFAVGGVDYVTKPFQAEEVLARVDTHLTLRRLQQQLQNANEKMALELALAGEVQASFLLRDLPSIDGWDLSMALKPALQTSGDFFDLKYLPNGHLGILIADVVDKGVGAALFMTLSWILLRTYAEEYPDQPEQVLYAVNQRILTDTNANQFVTVFYGILDPVTGQMIYANAGHMPPILISPTDREQVRKLIGTGRPLGLFENEAWGKNTVLLDPGSLLVLYTDGVTEMQDSDNRFYGEARLCGLVEREHASTASALKDKILSDLDNYLGDRPQWDDIALIILRREPARQEP